MRVLYTPNKIVLLHLFSNEYVTGMMLAVYPICSTAKLRFYFGALMIKVRFLFRSPNRGRPTTKWYDLYFGAKCQ